MGDATDDIAMVAADEEVAERAEERLVERARAGEIPAFERLMEAHERVCFQAAYFITRNVTDAEEAVQDAFLKAHRALPRFRRGAPFRPWILTIVRNEATSRVRSQVRHVRIAEKYAPTVPSVSGDEGPGTALSSERRRELLEAVESLSPEHREVVIYRFFLELTQEETAQVLSIRTGTVKSRLSRALEKLETALSERA